MDFKEIPIKWANKGEKPPDSLQERGYGTGEKPKCQHHNYLFALFIDLIEDIRNVAGTALDELLENAHTHDNKGVLDTVSATKISNWDGAVTAKHTHENKTTLDKIESGDFGGAFAAKLLGYTVAGESDVDLSETRAGARKIVIIGNTNDQAMKLSGADVKTGESGTIIVANIAGHPITLGLSTISGDGGLHREYDYALLNDNMYFEIAYSNSTYYAIPQYEIVSEGKFIPIEELAAKIALLCDNGGG